MNAKNTLNSFLRFVLFKIYLFSDIPTPISYLFFLLNIVSTPAIINANRPAMNVLICEIPVDGNLPLTLSTFSFLLIFLTFKFSLLRAIFVFGSNVPISIILFLTSFSISIDITVVFSFPLIISTFENTLRLPFSPGVISFLTPLPSLLLYLISTENGISSVVTLNVGFSSTTRF